MESTKSKVFITDAGGYLGAHIAMAIIKSGNFDVRALVKKDNPKNMDPLNQAFGQMVGKEFEIVIAKPD